MASDLDLDDVAATSPKAKAELEELRAENERLKDQLKTCAKPNTDLADDVTKAVRRAWSLGQKYWMLGDSDSYHDNMQSDEIGRKFEALMKETRDRVLSGSATMKGGN